MWLEAANAAVLLLVRIVNHIKWRIRVKQE